jgi:hypothetical protein
MAFSWRHNGSSPVDDVPTVVVDMPIPDVWAQYAERRRERVRNAEQKFSEMIGIRLYDPDDKDAFDGQINAEAAEWPTEDALAHRNYCHEIGERLAEAENEVTRTEKKLATAEQELGDAEQKVLDALLRLGGRPTPVPTTNGKGHAAGVTDPAAPACAQSTGRWQDPVAMHRLHNPRWIRLLLLVAFGGDLAAFYVVLEQLFRSYPVVVAPVVLAFAAIAVLLSHAIGRSWRRQVARDPDRSDTWFWVPLGAWILLGMAAASGRLFFSNLSAPVLVFGTPGASTARGADLAILPAVIFFVLYISSGIGAMYVSHEAYNPAAMAYRLAVSLRDKARREVERCAGMYSAAQVRKARIEQEDARADKRLKRAELVTRNEVVGLKHFVRHRMAGNTDSPRGLALFMADAPEPVEIPAEDDL